MRKLIFNFTTGLLFKFVSVYGITILGMITHLKCHAQLGCPEYFGGSANFVSYSGDSTLIGVGEVIGFESSVPKFFRTIEFDGRAEGYYFSPLENSTAESWQRAFGSWNFNIQTRSLSCEDNFQQYGNIYGRIIDNGPTKYYPQIGTLSGMWPYLCKGKSGFPGGIFPIGLEKIHRSNTKIEWIPSGPETQDSWTRGSLSITLKDEDTIADALKYASTRGYSREPGTSNIAFGYNYDPGNPRNIRGQSSTAYVTFNVDCPGRYRIDYQVVSRPLGSQGPFTDHSIESFTEEYDSTTEGEFDPTTKQLIIDVPVIDGLETSISWFRAYVIESRCTPDIGVTPVSEPVRIYITESLTASVNFDVYNQICSQLTANARADESASSWLTILNNSISSKGPDDKHTVTLNINLENIEVPLDEYIPPPDVLQEINTVEQHLKVEKYLNYLSSINAVLTETILIESTQPDVEDKQFTLSVAIRGYIAEEDECDQCNSSGTCKPGQTDSSDASLNSIQYKVKVGSGRLGKESYYVEIVSQADSNQAQPSLLEFVQPEYKANRLDPPEVLYDTVDTTVIRQILSNEALVDVVPVDEHTFEARFYDRLESEVLGANYYQIDGARSPYSVIVFKNPQLPDGSYNLNTFIITEKDIAGGLPVSASKINEYHYICDTQTEQWSLTEYLAYGTEDSTLYRRTELNEDWVDEDTDGQNDYYRQIRSIYNTSDELEYREEQHFLDFNEDGTIDLDEKEHPIKSILDPEGRALTTTMEYEYVPAQGDEDPYFLLKEEVGPYGAWVKYEYEYLGEILGYDLIATYRPFKDTPISDYLNGRHEIVQRNYGAINRTVDGITYYGDRIVSSSYIGGTLMSRTIEENYALGAPGFNRISKVELNGVEYIQNQARYIRHPQWGNLIERSLDENGVYRIYDYQPDIDGGRVTTVTEGLYDSQADAIVEGTESVTIIDSLGREILSTVSDIQTGALLSNITTDRQENGLQTIITRTDNIRGLSQVDTYGCCALESVKSYDGTVTFYDQGYEIFEEEEVLREFSSVKREHPGADNTTHSITAKSLLDTRGRSIANLEIYSDDETVVIGRNVYNPAGELVASRDALNRQTTYSEYLDNGSRKSMLLTQPDGHTVKTAYYLDGQLYSTTGDVHGIRYVPSIMTVGGETFLASKSIFLKEDGSDSEEFEMVLDDSLARTRFIRSSFENEQGYLEAENVYLGATSLLNKTISQDGIVTKYVYDSLGRLTQTSVLFDPQDENDTLGKDLISNTPVQVVASKTVQASGGGTEDIYVYRRETSQRDGLNRVIQERSLDGFRSWVTRKGFATSDGETIGDVVIASTTTIDAAQKTQSSTTFLPDGSYAQRDAYLSRAIAEKYYRADGLLINGQSTVYNKKGQVWKQMDARNGETVFTYDALGRLKTTTTPESASGLGDQQTTTTVYFPNSDEVQTVQLPGHTAENPREIHYTYHPTGELEKSWGMLNYPVEYAYDYRGRRISMITWQAFNQASGEGISGSAQTQWHYSAKSGLLKEKEYVDGSKMLYEYEASTGRLWRTTNARNQKAEHTYNALGQLTYLDEDIDDTLPSIEYAFDAYGRLDALNYGVNREYGIDYTYSGPWLEKEIWISPDQPDAVIERLPDGLQRLGQIGLQMNGLTQPYQVDYGYEVGSSRLETIAQGDHKARYSYESLSSLRDRVAFYTNEEQKFAQNYQYDLLNRLTETSYDGASLPDIVLQYNQLNQRTSATYGGEKIRRYAYDDLGQLQQANYFQNDNGTPNYLTDDLLIPGQDYGFEYDSIGNRKTATQGNLEKTYNPNLLNQYHQPLTEGDARKASEDDDAGYAYAIEGASTFWGYEEDISSLVSVIMSVESPGEQYAFNAAPVRWSGDYFFKELDLSVLGGQSLFSDYSIFSVDRAGGPAGEDIVTTLEQGDVYFPQSPVTHVYDADGNLLRDGQWEYTWNSLNRLVAMETRDVAYLDGVDRIKLEFTYDPVGRRIRKKVFSWNDELAAFEAKKTVSFVYDDWNLIFEICNSASQIQTTKSFVWGLDLSKTIKGAGGVGGLLWQNELSNSNTYFCGFDFNGNITGVVDSQDSDVVAEFEYGPFGELIRTTGAKKDAFNFRFSTKYEDAETGLLYYGYRYYNAETGRWLNRDPIEEDGGSNLYSFLNNNALTKIDFLGLKEWRVKNSNGESDPGPIQEYFYYNDKGGLVSVRIKSRRNSIIVIAKSSRSEFPSKSLIRGIVFVCDSDGKIINRSTEDGLVVNVPTNNVIGESPTMVSIKIDFIKNGKVAEGSITVNAKSNLGDFNVSNSNDVTTNLDLNLNAGLVGGSLGESTTSGNSQGSSISVQLNVLKTIKFKFECECLEDINNEGPEIPNEP